MNEFFSNVVTKVTRFIADKEVSLDGKAPQIIVGVGVACAVAGTVMAVKKTLEVNDILDEAKEEVETVKKQHPEVVSADGTVTKNPAVGKELFKSYVKIGGKLVHHYWLPIALEGMGIILIFKGNGMLQARYVAAVGMYKALDEYHKGYAKRVVERFGEDAEYEIRNGISTKTVEVTETNEKGEEVTKRKKQTTYEDGAIRPLDILFDEVTCSNWTKDPEYNLMFLTNVLKLCNERLDRRGYLFVEEIREMLGYKLDDHATEAHLSGWTKPEGSTNTVDFGINYENAKNDPALKAFLDGDEPNVLLHLNYDGIIIGAGLQRIETLR